MTFRILSLDGGGSWAVIQALALGRLYPGMRGREILSHFDLATGNSGGSIVLAALLADYSPTAIASLFLSPATRGMLYRPVGGAAQVGATLGVGPRWSAAGKLAGLYSLLGETGTTPVSQLGKIVPGTHILIPSFSTDARRSVCFRSYNSSVEPTVVDASLALAVHASSSAPILYFDAPAMVGNLRLWDGAVAGLNNPVLAAVVEAVAAHAGEVAALSIGTAGTWLPLGPVPAGADARLYRTPMGDGTLAGVKLMAQAILSDPPDSATLHADLLTQGGVVRMNPLMRPVQPVQGSDWTLPAGFTGLTAKGPVDAFQRLQALDMDVTEQTDIELIQAFAVAWLRDAIPNQPTAIDALTGKAQRGHETASAAIAAWRMLAAG